jgi:hypothetical protein
LQKFDSHESAVALAKYLGSRFHPELPHIGTVGTADVEDEVEKDYQEGDDELAEKDELKKAEEHEKKVTKDETMTHDLSVISRSAERQFSSFKFVPHTASYVMNLAGQNKNLVTTFSFYIRIDEGSWHDLEKDDNPGYQPDGVDETREKGFWLTKDELAKSFRKFDLTIESDIKTKKHGVTLKVDGGKVNIDGLESLTANHTQTANSSKIEIILKDKSKPFLTRAFTKAGTNYGIVEQEYNIVFTKEIEILDNGNAKIIVNVTNASPPTEVSVTPRIELKSGSEYETREETVQRYRDEVLVGSDQEKELYQYWKPILYSKKDAAWSVNGSRYGHLLEFSITEDGINCTNDPYEHESEVEHIINLVYDERLNKSEGVLDGKIIFANHIIFEEQIPPMAKGEKTSTMSKKVGMSEELAAMLEKRWSRLYKFQYDSISAINSAIGKSSDSAVLISSRTGGGKTEAFLIPIIDYCISKLEVSGTKAIIFYPTKALANDQTSRIISLLYDVNKDLKASGKKEKITVGLSHSDVPKSDKALDWQMYFGNGVPLRCPVKDCPGFLAAVEHTKVRCGECAEELDFVILFQEPNFGILPDILITNPDKLQWDMIYKPDHHGIFGREIVCCKQCYQGSAMLGKMGRGKCDSCKCNKFELKKPEPPRFIVFDEVHQFKGTFGGNALYLHERLRTMFKRYARQNGGKDWPVCSIGSSATVADAQRFSETFFGLDKNDIEIVPKDKNTRISYYEDAKTYARTHLFVMPYRYRPISTCAKAVGYTQARRVDGIKAEPFSEKFADTGKPLQTLGFVNSISDAGHLINSTEKERKYIGADVTIDGHTTDFGREQRGQVEMSFNKKELNVIFATSTLEVGVDFETVNMVVIYGFPFSFNEYIQRIGRGGRGENTLVVTICHNWKPIDHYYYVDAKKKISLQHQWIEPIPISRDNPQLIKNHLIGSLLDYISSLPDSPDLFNNLRDKMLGEFEARKNDMCDPTKEFVPINSLGLTDKTKEEGRVFLKGIIDREIQRMQGQIQPVKKWEFFFKFKNSLGEIYKFTNLRGTEKTVAVETIWEVFE